MDTNKKQQSTDWNRHEARKIPQNESMPQDDKISEDQNRQMNNPTPTDPNLPETDRPEGARH